jgi:hypothetical protein
VLAVRPAAWATDAGPDDCGFFIPGRKISVMITITIVRPKAPSVQLSSRAVLPRICGGSTPRRWRYLASE